MNQILEGQARKCQKSLQKLRKHIEKIGGVEKCATVHGMLVDILEALENGTPVIELHALCEKLEKEVEDYTDLDLKQYSETFAANVKKLDQQADYLEFTQIITQNQTADDAEFWTHQTEEEDDIDLNEIWNQTVRDYYNDTNLEVVFTTFTTFAKSGLPAAFYFLGMMYENGQYVEKNLSTAYDSYMKGATPQNTLKPDADCQVKLYLFYKNGTYVAKNHQTALSWLQKAVDANNSEALYYMASEMLYFDVGNKTQAFAMAKRSHDAGFRAAKILMAYCYVHGYGVGINFQEADRLIKQAEQEGFDVSTYRDDYNDTYAKSRDAQTSSNSSSNSSSGNGSPTKKGKDSSSGCGCAFLIALLLVVLYWFGAFDWVKDLFKEDLPNQYVIAENLNLRQSPSETGDIIKTVSYNTAVTPYESEDNTGKWLKVKADGEKGYMSKRGLASESDMSLLNSVWGDDAARESVRKLNCRQALIHFRQNVVSDTNYKLYGDDYSGKNIFETSSVRSDDNGAFAFIVDNKDTGERMAVLYLYDDDGNAVLDNTDDTVRPGLYIKAIKCNRKGIYYFQYGGKATKSTSSSSETSPSPAKSSHSSASSETSPSPEQEKVEETPEGDGFKIEKVDKVPGGSGFKLERVEKVPE